MKTQSEKKKKKKTQSGSKQDSCPPLLGASFSSPRTPFPFSVLFLFSYLFRTFFFFFCCFFLESCLAPKQLKLSSLSFSSTSKQRRFKQWHVKHQGSRICEVCVGCLLNGRMGGCVDKGMSEFPLKGETKTKKLHDFSPTDVVICSSRKTMTVILHLIFLKFLFYMGV